MVLPLSLKTFSDTVASVGTIFSTVSYTIVVVGAEKEWWSADFINLTARVYGMHVFRRLKITWYWHSHVCLIAVSSELKIDTRKCFDSNSYGTFWPYHTDAKNHNLFLINRTISRGFFIRLFITSVYSHLTFLVQ